MLRKLWNHFKTHVIHDEKGQWGSSIGGAIGGGIGLFGGPGMAALGAGAGAGIGSMFDPKESKDDPLAGIRQQLQSLASRVPGLVSRRQEQIRDIFGEARETGLEDIGEEMRGERGFGATTIEPERRVELLRKLGLSESEALLQAEFGGLELEAGILGRMGEFTRMPTEEPSFVEQLFGVGGELLGQELGFGRLEDILKPEEEEDILKIKKRRGTVTTKSPLEEAGGIFSEENY